MNNNEETNLFFRIINHLNNKKGKQDDFNGIFLAIHETEMKNLQNKIITSISHLIKEGIINDSKDQNGISYYQLVNDKKINGYLKT
jgi:hypothetical protein